MLEGMLNGASKRALDSSEIQAYLLQCYDVGYGLTTYDIDQLENTLAIVEMKEGEKLYDEESPLYRRYIDYLKMDIKGSYGYNFDEWINKTRIEQNLMIRALDEHRAELDIERKNSLRDLEDV